MKTAVTIFVCLLSAPAAFAGPITASLEGCISVGDARLDAAVWSAAGTLQAVAFDDDAPGCAPTIAHPVGGAYAFDDDRLRGVLTAWLDVSMLPVCGRRQYDLQPYQASGVLDPLGLKSIVVDTGVPCVAEAAGGAVAVPIATRTGAVASVPEPSALGLLSVTGAAWILRCGASTGRRRQEGRGRARASPRPRPGD